MLQQCYGAARIVLPQEVGGMEEWWVRFYSPWVEQTWEEGGFGGCRAHQIQNSFASLIRLLAMWTYTSDWVGTDPSWPIAGVGAYPLSQLDLQLEEWSWSCTRTAASVHKEVVGLGCWSYKIDYPPSTAEGGVASGVGQVWLRHIHLTGLTPEPSVMQTGVLPNLLSVGITIQSFAPGSPSIWQKHWNPHSPNGKMPLSNWNWLINCSGQWIVLKELLHLGAVLFWQDWEWNPVVRI